MMHAGALFLAAALAFPAWAGGDASDGHTHAGETPAPVPITASAPRAVAATEEFEVVAVLEDKHLRVYVDRYASNEPVAGAKVEVECGGPAVGQAWLDHQHRGRRQCRPVDRHAGHFAGSTPRGARA